MGRTTIDLLPYGRNALTAYDQQLTDTAWTTLTNVQGLLSAALSSDAAAVTAVQTALTAAQTDAATKATAYTTALAAYDGTAPKWATVATAKAANDASQAALAAAQAQADVLSSAAAVGTSLVSQITDRANTRSAKATAQAPFRARIAELRSEGPTVDGSREILALRKQLGDVPPYSPTGLTGDGNVPGLP